MRWRIYYGDGETQEGDGPLESGDRSRDVQVIVQHHPDVGWYTQSSSDYYIWRGDRWVGVDQFGLYDYLLETGLVLFGRTITNGEFQAVMDRAIADRTLARKTGWLGRNQERMIDGAA